MQMLNTRFFQAKEYTLIIYNGQALINKAFQFFTIVDCVDLPYEEIDFDFPEITGAYFRIYNERLGRLILTLIPIQSGPYLIINASISDMTFEDNGDYYYEVGYSRSGYEQALRYGKLQII